jgi:hypothetical protein
VLCIVCGVVYVMEGSLEVPRVYSVRALTSD